MYGSPRSDPEHPSAESTKIAESLVLLEFVADLYPDSGLLPKDPVERARVRSFINAVSTKLLPTAGALFACGAATEIQELLPSTAQFAVGDHFTIADATLASFLGCWELSLRNDVGKFAEGTGPRLHQELFRSEHFARLQKYYENISSRESFKNSFDSVRLHACWPRAQGLRLTIWPGILVGKVKDTVRSTVNAKRLK